MMTKHRQYSYVGSHAILEVLDRPSDRMCVQSSDNIRHWIEETQQSLNKDNMVVATFIIDVNQQLWIADQRSEHVRCAAGQNVLSAGEMTFAVNKNRVEVVEVTNQSTGYCPEPESWDVVAEALSEIGLSYPLSFTTAFLFRSCENCGATNIIKDMWFECAVCQSPLSQKWNFETGNDKP